MLRTEHRVVHCLVTYTDWWQPATASVLQVGAARRSGDHGDGFGSGLLETLDERTEICRRVWRLKEADRHLLFLWYVEQHPVEEISHRLDISRRQCFRRRNRAIQTIIDLGESGEAA
jgi:DNA-directed RNA polymerase specialized sigma subunit